MLFTSRKLLFILRLILDICLQTKIAFEALPSIPIPVILIYFVDLSLLYIYLLEMSKLYNYFKIYCNL